MHAKADRRGQVIGLHHQRRQAGGKAITCSLERILDMEPNALHQRVTVAMGSPDMIDDMKEFVERYSA